MSELAGSMVLWKQEIFTAIHPSRHHCKLPTLISCSSLNDRQPIRASIDRSLSFQHSQCARRRIYSHCARRRTTEVKCCETKYSEVRSNVEQDHSGPTMRHKAIEFRNLIRIADLGRIGHSIRGRMAHKWPAWAQLNFHRVTKTVLDLIPPPMNGLAAGSHPAPCRSRN